MGRKGGERSVENVNSGKLGVLRENDLLPSAAINAPELTPDSASST